MLVELHLLTAAVYLAATVAALLGLALPAPPAGRVASVLLLVGAVVHAVAFTSLHAATPPPPLTNLPAAASMMAWMAVVFCLLLMLRGRLLGLAALVAPLAFVAVVFAGERLALQGALPPSAPAAGAWAHLHVILASAGFALLGVAGLAGLLFLAAEGRLKSKRPAAWGRRLPSLEVLDRINVVALAVGFPLLTLAVVAGLLWSRTLTGRLWPGGAHVIGLLAAWGVYAGLAGARFGAGWRGREAAASALVGFGFLLVALLGAEFVA